ncbi:RNA polymerase sigma-70 factor [bacterium]|nr:RNA polymerase sigma-70 factor [bacterium]
MAEIFDAQHKRLFAIAYRMLGSVMDAEDIVQEAYLRWRDIDQTTVENPGAFLATMVTRLCIDHLRSARVQREEYIGPWLPEPLVPHHTEPEESLKLAESLSMAFLVMLERLTPTERAVYLLREVFDYDYREIAAVVNKSEPACRQIVSRVKARMVEERPRLPLTEAMPIVQQMVAAVRGGDVPGLMALLAPDVELTSDGGGKAKAATRPLYGRKLVATFLFVIHKNLPPDANVQIQSINGQPGVVVQHAGKVFTVGTLDITEEGVKSIRLVLNPDKLKHVMNLN